MEPYGVQIVASCRCKANIHALCLSLSCPRLRMLSVSTES
jgi:hypothetical protein